MSITDTNILLETGTNELEVLEFAIAGNSFGINVAKVLELMQVQIPQSMPNSHPCIEGIFQPRKDVYTVVNLARYLGLPESENPEKDIYIISNFNKMNVSFHVHSVESIHRISWQAIEKPDTIIYGGDEGVVTGITKINGRIVSILDFEKIAFDICPDTGIQMSDIENLMDREKTGLPILIAEDSALLRKMILQALRASGYTNVISTSNGEEAWRLLLDIKKDHGGNFRSEVNLLITDIEMPLMDGHHLTKLVKTDPVLNGLPVVIFSSLIDENMHRKGLEVGADAQLSKPEIANLVTTIDALLNR